MRSFITLALLASISGIAHADKDDGYCDYVEGVANAQAAVQMSPELIGAVGYVEQPSADIDAASQKGVRLIAGVRYRLSGLYEGTATRNRAKADCRRYRALEQVRGETTSRAIAARVAVLDDALKEADKILRTDEADFAARRMTAQEATATRVRVEELRELAAEDHRQLSALPPPSAKPLAGALQAYRSADSDMERYEAKLRRAEAIDVSVRFGIDQYPERDNPQPYFAVLSVGVNLGLLFQAGPNSRAAKARKQLVQSGRGIGVEGTVDRLRATVEIEAKRAKETEALVKELERQLDALNRIAGEESKRYRQTVWFEWVKAKAQHVYLTTHVESIKEVLGGNAE
ncbi:MAG TPA: hypothetical protein VIV11_14635 [Kofleriaceae bacterium]